MPIVRFTQIYRLVARGCGVGNLNCRYHVGKNANKLEEVKAPLGYGVEAIYRECFIPGYDEWTVSVLTMLRQLDLVVRARHRV